jgi:adenine-specific DNA methylase
VVGIKTDAQAAIIEKNRPRVLIEEWLPIQALGVEARRERGASSALPAVNFLHVWWARRPLIVSRAAVLASLLPADFPQDEFMKLMRILGDPVAGMARLDRIHSGEEHDPGGNLYG